MFSSTYLWLRSKQLVALPLRFNLTTRLRFREIRSWPPCSTASPLRESSKSSPVESHDHPSGNPTSSFSGSPCSFVVFSPCCLLTLCSLPLNACIPSPAARFPHARCSPLPCFANEPSPRLPPETPSKYFFSRATRHLWAPVEKNRFSFFFSLALFPL